MAMVKFTTTCDVPVGQESGICGRRAGEYTAWPSCRSCYDNVCPAHQVPGSLTEADVDCPETCLCMPCGADPEIMADDAASHGHLACHASKMVV